jgi:hypothetical protein
MKNYRIAFYFIIFSAVGFTLSPNLKAAESYELKNEPGRCAIPSFQKAFEQAGAVFAGEVLSVEKNGDTKTFEFRMDKYWKGAGKRTIKINVYETPRFQAFFKPGEKYLVFAEADTSGKLHVVRCSRSREISGAAEDLKSLGKAKTPRN